MSAELVELQRSLRALFEWARAHSESAGDDEVIADAEAAANRLRQPSTDPLDPSYARVLEARVRERAAWALRRPGHPGPAGHPTEEQIVEATALAQAWASAAAAAGVEPGDLDGCTSLADGAYDAVRAARFRRLLAGGAW